MWGILSTISQMRFSSLATWITLSETDSVKVISVFSFSMSSCFSLHYTEENILSIFLAFLSLTFVYQFSVSFLWNKLILRKKKKKKKTNHKRALCQENGGTDTMEQTLPVLWRDSQGDNSLTQICCNQSPGNFALGQDYLYSLKWLEGSFPEILHKHYSCCEALCSPVVSSAS